MTSSTRPEWESLHGEDRFAPKIPSEWVVRCFMGTFGRDPSTHAQIKALDIGVGAGRHSKFLLQEGFDVWGVDQSEAGLRRARLLAGPEREDRFIRTDSTHLPFTDSFFDAALSFGVFYYGTEASMRKSIAEMYRVLKPGGHAFVNLRSTRDFRMTLGPSIGKNTVMIENPATNEAGMPMHFLDLEDVQDYFKSFSRIQIDKNEFTEDGMKTLQSDWNIRLTK